MPERLQTLFGQMLDGFALHEIVLDSAGKPVDYRFLAVNPAFEEITGLKAENIVGRRVLEVLPDIERSWIENYGRVALSGEPLRFENFYAGMRKHFDVIAFRPRLGQFACVFRDITERKTREAEIKRLTHLYAVLSQVNQAIVRSASREELFRSICRVAVEDGRFRLAWIGSLDPDSGIVTLDAAEEDGRGSPFAIAANECGVVRASLHRAQPVVCNEVTDAQSGAHCHHAAKQAEIGSCAAFPIRRHGRVCAALCLHARAADFFNSAEVELLEKVAADISFALEKLEQEENLVREMEFNRALLENITDGVVACDAEGKLAFFNRTAREWHCVGAGAEPASEWPRHCGLFAANEITPLAQEENPLSRAFCGEEVRDAHLAVLCNDKPPRQVLASGRAIYGGEGRKLGAVVVLHDVSERKRHEAERETTLKLLKLLNSPNNTRELIAAVTGYLQEWSGCEAVGIRLREGDDFPYYETSGFGAEFVRAESRLCALGPGEELTLDSDGKPRLACMCGNVIRGRFDSSLPWFTRGGAFWTNDAMKLAATVAEERLHGPFRGRCLGEGYRSIALIPLRAGGETIGLMQFSDRRPDRLSPESIELLERAAASVATALAERKAQAALRETEQRLQAIIDQTPSLIYVKNLEGQFTRVNNSFELFFGYTRNELLGKTGHDLLTADIAESHRANDLEVLRRREAVYFEERAVLGGQERTFLSIKFPLVDSAGAISSICGISTDITDRQRAEKEKASLEDQLRQSQRLESIGRLAGGIAHDFNNLLTVIAGYGDLILRQLEPGDPLHQFMGEICSAGERAAGLTGQLLAFSRKQVIAPKALNLNSLISHTRNMLLRLIGEDIELSTSLDQSLGMAMGDEGLMHQVLINLAVNSRDAMPAGGVLSIKTVNFEADEAFAAAHAGMAPGPYVLMEVSDTGIGIPPEVKRHIFEPFFTTKSEGKGTGLGLSTVYGIIRQFGGWIWVSSEPGRGAAFRIYLPRIEGPVEAGASGSTSAGPLRGSETVLVVEDQDDVRHLAASVLRSYGYHVLEAAQGGEALLIVERHSGPIHLMLTDVVMPRMTGRELATRLAPLRPNMKVLYMSGYSDNVIARQGVLDADIAFIPKPFTPEALGAKVREVLGRPVR